MAVEPIYLLLAPSQHKSKHLTRHGSRALPGSVSHVALFSEGSKSVSVATCMGEIPQRPHDVDKNPSLGVFEAGVRA